jgi:hypothetical protein
VLLVASERTTRIASREITRGLPLPLRLLATDGSQFLVASSFSDCSKGRARLDGLELFRIPDQNRLGSRFVKLREHPGHLPAPDHPGLVDHEHVAT